MNLFILLPLIPMLGGILTLIYHFKNQNTNLITNIFITLSLILSVVLMLNYNDTELSFSFIKLDNIDFKILLKIDKLSLIMLLVINFISFIIHRYSTNYLSSDVTQGRFMAQLSILTFAVSLLAISGNLLTAFIAWQFIGISLYILLNHYHYNIYANKAAKKKFVINRLGDASFLFAVILCYKFSGSSDFNCLQLVNNMISILGVYSISVNTIVVLMIFIAVMTKSAQFPFHIWLPDTMEAPTPVSAIMHAGVINAGGILLTRIHGMLDLSNFASDFIFTIGILTIIFSAFFILTQSDVKKQLAYSTMGQMGYMVVECSLGLYAAAIFHLIAHGFFKAFLFLSSGNNIGQVNKNLIRSKGNDFNKIIKIAVFLLAYFFIAKLIYNNMNNSLLFSGAFILVTLINIAFDLLNFNSVKKMTKILIYLSVIIVFLVFFYMSIQFGQLIGFNTTLNNNLHWDSYKLGWLILIIIIQLLSWVNISILSRRIQFLLYDLSRNKLFIEELFRKILINPFRRLGHYLNVLFANKYFKFSMIFINVLITYCAIFQINIIELNLSIIIIQTFFMLYIITANKARNIRLFSSYILLSQICLIDMGLYLLNSYEKKFLYYQIFNSLLIYFAINILFDKTNINKKVSLNLNFNKLSATKTYFTLLIVCWIGLPSTPSFINEFYVLYSLSGINLYLISITLISFIFLAIAILHALQEYIFNSSNNISFKTNISNFEHCFLWACLIINLLVGIMPNTLLNLLS